MLRLPARTTPKRRWNSLKAQKDGSPWPEGAQLTFEACPQGAISYTQAAQPAVNVRISRNSKFYMQGPFECTP